MLDYTFLDLHPESKNLILYPCEGIEACPSSPAYDFMIPVAHGVDTSPPLLFYK